MQGRFAGAQLRLLDLYCGGGGAAVGYHRAAYQMGLNLHIVGVDIKEQPRYPFEFVRGDAMEYVKKNWWDFTHIHASPPCQIYSKGCGERRNKGVRFADHLDETRNFMYSIGLPGVLENVEDSPLRPDLLLNGTMFGLKLIRKRKFETVNWFCLRPGSGQIPRRAIISGKMMCVAGNGSKKSRSGAPIEVEGETVLAKASNAMGIDWMTYRELKEAIPPAYTEYIGLSFFKTNTNYYEPTNG